MFRSTKYLLLFARRFWILWASIAILAYRRFSLPNHSIGGLIFEYEDFSHDLPATVGSIGSLVKIMSIYNERLLYPPLSQHTYQHFSEAFQKFRFFEMKRSISDSYASLNIESFFEETEFILIFPDGLRPFNGVQIEQKLQQTANWMAESNVDAVIYPVVEKSCETDSQCRFTSNLVCNPFVFYMEKWTLRYYDKNETLPSSFSCDYTNDNGFVIFIRRSKFFSLHKPFLRPFMKSFAIQADFLRLKLELHNENYFYIHTVIPDGRLQQKKLALDEYRKLKLYQELGIKRIQKSNGEADEWHGCDRQHSRCFGTIIDGQPDYLFQDRLLPPCCHRHLEITGRYVLELLTKTDVRHWLEGGSLLGAARNGQIIPWDFDIDIGLYREDIHKLGDGINELLHSLPGTKLEDSNGFVWEKATEGDFLRVHFSIANRIHVDLFPFYPKNGIMTKDTWFQDHPQDCEFPESFLQPLTAISFIGMNASAPANVREFLEYKFGDGVIGNPKLPGNFNIKYSGFD